MTCPDARAALLAGEPDEEARRHLASCPACRAEAPGLLRLRRVLSAEEIWDEPPPEAVARILAAVTDGTPSRQRRRLPTWIAAAALVLVGVLAGLTLGPSGPDWEVEVVGTSLAPTAVGTVRGWATESGSRLVVDVDGLDPAPDGAVYELWLSSADRHVSAGTFTGTDGVELWAGVPRREYPRIWVTIEPLDTDPSPSGRTVLDTPGWTGR